MDNLLEYFEKSDGIVEAQVEGFKWSENVKLLEDSVLVDELEAILPYCQQLDFDILPTIFKFHQEDRNLTKTERKLLESTYILVSSKYSIDAENGDLVIVTSA